MGLFGNKPLKVGLVGLGKIARDQHIPAIRSRKDIRLVAGCSPHDRPEGLDVFPDMAAMLAAKPEIEAVSLCTPPQVRFQLAVAAITAGKHVFLEKPPAATLGEAEALKAMASLKGVSLLASWHSRFAPAVERARLWMSTRRLSEVSIMWKENVRQWHPGQAWIFEPGGMGVFDPGINALSILTRIMPQAVVVKKADLHIPGNCAAPIQAEIDMASVTGTPIRAEFDFLQTGRQTWTIEVTAASGETLTLSLGGAQLEIDGKAVDCGPEAEYAGLYAHFAGLVRSKTSDADLAPLRLVADSMLLGRRITAPDYVE